jgi:hypothetical protein
MGQAEAGEEALALLEKAAEVAVGPKLKPGMHPNLVHNLIQEEKRQIVEKVKPEIEAAKGRLTPLVEHATSNKLARQALADLMEEMRDPRTGRVDMTKVDEVLQGDMGKWGAIAPDTAAMLRKWELAGGAKDAEADAALVRIARYRAAIADSILAVNRKNMGGAQSQGEVNRMSESVYLGASRPKLQAFLDNHARMIQAERENAMPMDPLARHLFILSEGRDLAQLDTPGRSKLPAGR